MHSVKLVADRNMSGNTKDQESVVGKAASKAPKLVRMGSALKETRGIGRGLEYFAYPKGY
jgi:hypothetical protein